MAARLVVEVDGDKHETKEGKQHDANRDRYLRSLGFEVLRLDEPDVAGNTWHYAQLAKQEAERLLCSPSRPLRGHPPLKGEGT